MASSRKPGVRRLREPPGADSKHDKTQKSKWPPVPAPLMDMVFNLLYEHGYSKAGEYVRAETEIREKAGASAIPCSWTQAAKNYPSLVQVFNEWQAQHPDIKHDAPLKAEKMVKSEGNKGSNAEGNAHTEIDQGEERATTRAAALPKARITMNPVTRMIHLVLKIPKHPQPSPRSMEPRRKSPP